MKKRKLQKEKLNDWWSKVDFITMEKITGLKQLNYDSSEGYQAFVDACEAMWKALSTKEKVSMWHKYK